MPLDHPTTSRLPRSWLAAAADPTIRAALESIFAAAHAAITARGPACWASGRCCNFAAAGHRLYTTGLEAAYALSPPPPPQTATSPDPRALPVLAPAPPTLTHDSLAAARHRGNCPFQAANLCGIHPLKPLACRLYFCDRASEPWQHALSERLLADVRALHDQHAIEYRYAEWRDHLELFLA